MKHDEEFCQKCDGPKLVACCIAIAAVVLAAIFL